MANNFLEALMSIRSLGRGIWVTLILLLVIAAAAFLVARQIKFDFSSLLTSATLTQPVGDLPNMAVKPQPKESIFEGCPPQGQGGDSQLNLLKNRVDQGSYAAVSFDALTSLTWPKSVEGLTMENWPPDGAAFIAKYEGVPVMVEGYIDSVKEALPEPANCNRTDKGNLNWLISFTQNARDEHSQAVIAEVTPRIRSTHYWSLDILRSVIMNDHMPVRISGWLFFNPGLSAELGSTRSTLWEIQPVMQIEVFQNGRWITLDRFYFSTQ